MAPCLTGLALILPFTLAAQEPASSSLTDRPEITIASPARRSPDVPLTLRDCIAIALGESPVLEASRFDLLAASEEIHAERAMALPQLTGSASAEIFSGDQTGKFSVVNVTNPSGVGVNTASRSVDLGELDIFGARLRYPLFQDGSILGLNNAPKIAGKKAEKEALGWTTHLRRDEVIYRITDAFITTVSAQNRAGFVEHRVELLEQSSANTQEQQKQGLLLPIDLRVAQEQLRGAQSLSRIIRQQAVAGTVEMARLLGLPPSSKVRLSSTLPEPPEPPSAEQLLGTSLNEHPSLQLQRATIDKAKQDYRLERFRLYPSVSLDGRAIYVDDFHPPGASLYTGAITVSVPIFDFGAQAATVRAKMATYKAEQVRLASVADDVTYNVLKTYQQIYSLSQNILTIQGEIAKADRDVRVAASQQQQGIAQPLTAVEAELFLIGKRDDLEALKARRLLFYAALQRDLGGAWKWIP